MRLFRTLLTLLLVALVVPSASTAMRANAHAACASVVSSPASESAIAHSLPGSSEHGALPEVPGGTNAGATDDDDRDPTGPERAGSDEASILEVGSLAAPSFCRVSLFSEAGDAPAPIEQSPAKRPPRA